MLSFFDFLILNTMMSCHGSSGTQSDAGEKAPAPLLGIKRDIVVIKKDLGFDYSEQFFKPVTAAGICAAFADGVTDEKRTEAIEKAEKLKSYSQIEFAKSIISKQPMTFDDLKPYLNQVHPHYYRVLDYFIRQVMLSVEDFTPAQKSFIKQWNEYQKSRLYPE
jgi:hypothetical protein